MTGYVEMRRVVWREVPFKEWFFIHSLIWGKWSSGEHFQKCLKFPSDFGSKLDATCVKWALAPKTVHRMRAILLGLTFNTDLMFILKSVSLELLL